VAWQWVPGTEHPRRPLTWNRYRQEHCHSRLNHVLMISFYYPFLLYCYSYFIPSRGSVFVFKDDGCLCLGQVMDRLFEGIGYRV